MKKRLGCLSSFLLGVVVVYGIWALTPTSRYETQVQEILQRCAQRQLQDQKTAKDVAINAYLDPDFLPYWGRKDIEHKPGSETEKKLRTLDKYCDVRDWKETHLETAVQAKDPQMEAVFKEFAAFYPKVHKVCNQSQFIAPLDRPLDVNAASPTYLSFRAIGQFLSGYAEYLTLTQQPDVALRVAGDSLRLGWLFGHHQSTLMDSMMSLAVQSMGQSTVAMIYASSPKLASLTALEKISGLLEETDPPGSVETDTMETELYLVCNSFPYLTGEQVGGDVAGAASVTLPGLRARELRLFKNDFMPLLDQVRQGQPADLSWLEKVTPWSWVAGQHGWISKLSLPDYGRFQKQFALLRKRQAFLHLYTGLALAAQKQGQWPASLQELQSGGYKPLRKLDFAQVHYKLEGGKMELQLELKEDELVHHVSAPPHSEMAKWECLNYKTWTVHGPSLK